MLYVYALLDEPPGRAVRGMLREPILALRCAGMWVAAGEMSRVPDADLARLQAHDAAIRRLAGQVPAVLPARFGSLVADRRELRRRLAPRAAGLRRALRLVRGREQMTLRVFSRPGPRPAAPPSDPAPRPAGPGTRYLEGRRRSAAWPELDGLRAALAGVVRAERVERVGESAAGPLLGSVYHLQERGQARRYRQLLRRAAPSLPVIVRASGPWPPYAFAEELAA